MSEEKVGIRNDCRKKEMKTRIDSIGDKWIFCEKHNEWYPEGGFCSGCHPKMALWIKIEATVIALVIAGLYFGFLFYLIWTGWKMN